MSRRLKKKAPAVPSSAPVSPTGEMSGVADSRSPESESRPAGLNGRWTVIGICIFLAVITFVVFGQTLGHDFVNYDDDDYVYQNPIIQKGLTLRGIVWAFTHRHERHWVPLTDISHMLDCQLYGLNAGGHHLTNLLLHTASVILLFLVLRLMTGALWRSAFVAAVFAVHPLHVESVAWVTERKDVLSGLFFMLTLWAYVRYAQCKIKNAKCKMQNYCLALLFFACGLMSKAMIATLPLVLLLLDYWPLQRVSDFSQESSSLGQDAKPATRNFRQLVLEKIPFLGLILAISMGALFAPKEPIVDLNLMVRSGHALLTPLVYLGQMFYPAGLAVYSPPPNSFPLGEIALAITLLAASFVGVFVLRRKRPYFLVGWLWYLVMLAPVLVLIQQGMEIRCDRYTYLPQIGVYLLLTWAAADLCAGWRHRRVVLGGGSTIILVALIFCARVQTSYWRNSESLWTHTLACTSDNFIGHYNLGCALLQKGNVDEAIAQYQKALQIKPDYAEACYNLGCALLQKGNVDEAIAQYQKALQIKPDYAKACYNLGCALLQKGSVDEAIAQYQKALQITLDYAEAHNNLGSALFQESNVDEAIAHYQKALQIKPDFAEACYNLGCALLQKGNVDEAIAHFQKALQIKPDYAEACYNLGCALLQKGSVDEAIVYYQKALQITPDYAEAHYNLGNTLLQKGDVDEAIAHFQKALQIKPDFAEAQNNLAWVLATCPQASLRNGNKAVELAQRANQLTGDGNPVVLGTLAAAYAEAGRFPEAVETAQRALQLAERQSNTALADAIRSQLKLYQAGLPFHSH